jgi:hypothetical protein
MHKKRRSGLLGVALLAAACALAVAACNSDSVSGGQPRTSKSTNAESKTPSGSGPKGLIDSAIKHTGGG